MSNCKTFRIDASGQFLGDGGASVSGFISTGSVSENVLATISGWQPDGGSHPTVMFVKRVTQSGKAGIWFRVNFVNDAPNGVVWITFFQGGNPAWPTGAMATTTAFNTQPWH